MTKLGLLLSLVSIGATTACNVVNKPYWYDRTEAVRNEDRIVEVSVQVRSDPSGALVAIDDSQMGVTPCVLTFQVHETAVFAQKYREYWEFVMGQGMTPTKRFPVGEPAETARFVSEAQKLHLRLSLYKIGYGYRYEDITIPGTPEVAVTLLPDSK